MDSVLSVVAGVVRFLDRIAVVTSSRAPRAIAPFVFVVHRSGVRLGDTVAVTGLNFIGQIVAQGVKQSGARRVIAIDDNDVRLRVARELTTATVRLADIQEAYREASENPNSLEVVIWP
jgi:threonine dehydrogenase-like Zn-dependent dehydrogenase